MHLYSAFRSTYRGACGSTGGLSEFEQMGFQVTFESENVFRQLNVSRKRVPGGWSSNRESAMVQFRVCVRNSSIGASEESRARGSAWVRMSSLRYVGVAVVRTL